MRTGGDGRLLSPGVPLVPVHGERTVVEERERFEFFQRYHLVDAGRYWLNRGLQRCFVEEGRVIVMDPKG